MLSLLLFWTSLPSQRFWGRVKRSYFSVCISKLIWFLDFTEGEGGKETCTFPAFCFFSFLVFPWCCWSASDYWTGRKLPILKKKGIRAEEKERKRRRGEGKMEESWALLVANREIKLFTWLLHMSKSLSRSPFHCLPEQLHVALGMKAGLHTLGEAVPWLAAWHPTNPFHFISCIF